MISSSVVPFFSFLLPFLASESFPMSWLFTSGSQSIGFSFGISPSIEYSGLISFRIDWLDLLAVHGTLRNLLQHHHSKASIVQSSAFFMVLIYTLVIYVCSGSSLLLFSLISQSVVLVAHLCPTLCNPMDWGLPGSSVHGILQARILERVALSLPRRSSWPRDWTQVSCTAGRLLTVWATGKLFDALCRCCFLQGWHLASPCGGSSCYWAQALDTRASVFAACVLSCSIAWGIFPDQGSNLCPLL